MASNQLEEQQANSEANYMRVVDGSQCCLNGHKVRVMTGDGTPWHCGESTCKYFYIAQLTDMQPSDSDSPQSDANAPSHPSKTITIEELLSQQHSEDSFICDSIDDKPCNCWVKLALSLIDQKVLSELENIPKTPLYLYQEMQTKPHLASEYNSKSFNTIKYIKNRIKELSNISKGGG